MLAFLIFISAFIAVFVPHAIIFDAHKLLPIIIFLVYFIFRTFLYFINPPIIQYIILKNHFLYINLIIYFLI